MTMSPVFQRIAASAELQFSGMSQQDKETAARLGVALGRILAMLTGNTTISAAIGEVFTLSRIAKIVANLGDLRRMKRPQLKEWAESLMRDHAPQLWAEIAAQSKQSQG